MQNRANTLNPKTTVIPGDLVGEPMSRKQFAIRRNMDRQNRDASFLDKLGELIITDDENLYAVPADKLGDEKVQAILADLSLTRIKKIVVSTEAGVLCTATGHVPETWLRTISKIALPKSAESDRHFVKAFAPSYVGPVIGFHSVRMPDNDLNTRTIRQVHGLDLAEVDFVGYEGKAYFGLATVPTHFQKGTIFTREAPISALREMKSVNNPWTPSPWAKDINVQGLRGFVRDGKLCYTFLDTEKNAIYLATPHNGKVTQASKAKAYGLFTLVSGVPVVKNHLATIVTPKGIVAVCDNADDKVIDDFSGANQEIGAFMREQYAQGYLFGGVLGKEAGYLAYAQNAGSMPTLQVTKTYEARA